MNDQIIDDEKYKVKGEVENYLNSTETIKGNISLKLLVKVQSCVRRFLQTSKFLKEHKNNRSVIFIKRKSLHIVF